MSANDQLFKYAENEICDKFDFEAQFRRYKNKEKYIKKLKLKSNIR